MGRGLGKFWRLGWRAGGGFYRCFICVPPLRNGALVGRLFSSAWAKCISVSFLITRWSHSDNFLCFWLWAKWKNQTDKFQTERKLSVRSYSFAIWKETKIYFSEFGCSYTQEISHRKLSNLTSYWYPCKFTSS